MKKEELMEIKTMFLEALNEFTNRNINTMSVENSENEGTSENELGTSEGNEGDEGDDSVTDKGGNSNIGANSGGTPSKDGKPKPNVGIGVL